MLSLPYLRPRLPRPPQPWEKFRVSVHGDKVALRCLAIKDGPWLSALPEGKVLAQAPHIKDW